MPATHANELSATGKFTPWLDTEVLVTLRHPLKGHRGLVKDLQEDSSQKSGLRVGVRFETVGLLNKNEWFDYDGLRRAEYVSCLHCFFMALLMKV